MLAWESYVEAKAPHAHRIHHAHTTHPCARDNTLGLGEQVCHLPLWTVRSDPLAARLPGTDLSGAYCW